MHGWLAKMRGTLLGNEELRSKVSAINPLVWLANFIVWHRESEKWGKLELHEKEERGIIVHQPDAVSFQSLVSTWVHRRSLSVDRRTLGGIRHDNPIVLIQAIRAIGAATVLVSFASHQIHMGPLERHTAAGPRHGRDHILAAPEPNGQWSEDYLSTMTQI